MNNNIFMPSIKGLLTQSNFFIRKYIFDFIKNNNQYINGKIMDFGCGESPYKNLFSYSMYIGIDFGETGHNNTKNKNITYYNGKNIQFDNDYFDSFICTEVLEHVFNIEELLVEINRVLKKGGYGLITIPFCIEEHEKPYDFARYSSFGIKDILEKKGFKIIDHKKTGSYGKVSLQITRNYLGVLFSSNNLYINLLLKIIFIIPIHITFIVLFYIIPNGNKDLYFNNALLVQKL